MHFDLNQWVGFGELFQDPWQKAHQIVIRRADAHQSHHMRLAQGIEHFTVQFQDAPRITQQHLAFGREPYLPAIALEQFALQHVFFQTLHLHADRRLSAIDGLAGTGETALVGNGDEGAQHVCVDAGIGGQLINLRDVMHKKHSLD